MTMRQKDRAKAEGEAEDGGSRKGVVGVEATTQGRTRFAQKREGSTTRTSTTGGATCTDW